MAFEDPGKIISVVAGQDLSTYQYHFVKMSADGQVDPCTASTDSALGVLQNVPDAAGKAASVMVSGISKVVANETIAAGELITPAADAEADDADTSTDKIIGIALTGGAAGEVISVLLDGRGGEVA